MTAGGRVGGDRPRDALGRPLPPDADPLLVVASVPDRTHVDSYDALREADDYLARGMPFHAHEVLEQRWRCAPPDERPLWRALAQWAAALTHAARGNPRGARAVGARALVGLESYAGPAVHGVDLEGRAWALAASALRSSCADLATGSAPVGPAPRLLSRGAV